ncbi:MAG: response regulator transcription factor [Dorea sp.]|jgi:DNA-binding response OmpR family regulator|nr:response regulator transcription factor [Dorea sp.]
MLIGIIEDDKLLNQALRLVLQKAGYRIICAHTRQEALSLMGREEDLLLVDIGLPDGNGISLYQELKGRREIPAIFLTARDEEQDMLAAFDTGADDYVVKPFSMKVLLKRIEAVLKRNNEKERLSYRELLLFPAGKQVFVEGREIRLTAKEYQMLEYLMENQGQVLTKEMILEKIWGLEGQFVVDNTVSVTINRLRKKLEPDAGQSSYIKNVFGLGYRIGDK